MICNVLNITYLPTLKLFALNVLIYAILRHQPLINTETNSQKEPLTVIVAHGNGT